MAQTTDLAPAEPIQTESLVPIPPEVKQNVFVTSVNTLFNWARSNALSVWRVPSEPSSEKSGAGAPAGISRITGRHR